MSNIMSNILLCNDYVHNSKLKYFFINNLEFVKYNLDYDNEIDYGIINFNIKNKNYLQFMLYNRFLYNYIEDGIY